MEGVRLPLNKVSVWFFYPKQAIISYPSIPLDTFRWVGRSFIVHNKTNGTSVVLLSLICPPLLPKTNPRLLFLQFYYTQMLVHCDIFISSSLGMES